MLPLDLLAEHHRRHYEPGTLERFVEWFGRSGYGAMLQNSLLRGEPGQRVPLTPASLKFSELSGLTFSNVSERIWHVEFALEIRAESVESLFRNFVRCTGHTHPIGDFRLHLGYFTDVLAGPRFFMFHGSGSCLLLGAMFQANAAQILGERIDLHYSHAEHREFTHVFGTWRDEYFVDPDQKTWVPIKEIDDVPSLGYIFQQFGVAGHLIYRGLTAEEVNSLFARMTRDYFEFYNSSVQQYMYNRRHEIGRLAQLFHEARTKYCSPFSVEAADFPWKGELRHQARMKAIPNPYFSVRAADGVIFDIPPGGALRIGIGEDDLPEEVNILAAIFFGRTPASLSVPLGGGHPESINMPELPWLLVFEKDVRSVAVGGRRLDLRLSRCGRFAIAGMGDLEKYLRVADGSGHYRISIEADDAREARIVFPLNAFAFSSALVRCKAELGPGRFVDGRIVA